jgi:uncharacterized protein (DUF4415 family)
LSRRGKLINVKGEDIFNKPPLTRAQKAQLRRSAERQAAGDESNIDFSDIPPLSEEQLANMVRLRNLQRKVAVSVRLDPRVLEWLKSKGEGHLTRINDILLNLMEAEQRLKSVKNSIL